MATAAMGWVVLKAAVAETVAELVAGPVVGPVAGPVAEPVTGPACEPAFVGLVVDRSRRRFLGVWGRHRRYRRRSASSARFAVAASFFEHFSCAAWLWQAFRAALAAL